jgi:Secretion system C-terminal sorting domain
MLDSSVQYYSAKTIHRNCISFSYLLGVACISIFSTLKHHFIMFKNNFIWLCGLLLLWSTGVFAQKDESWNSPSQHVFVKNKWKIATYYGEGISDEFLRKYTYDHSDFIFEGKVIKQDFYFHGAGTNLIFANDIIQITKVIKGDLKLGTVELKTRHGILEGSSGGNPCVVDDTEGVFYCNAAEDSIKTRFKAEKTNAIMLKLFFDNRQGDCSVMDYHGYMGSVVFMGGKEPYYDTKASDKWIANQKNRLSQDSIKTDIKPKKVLSSIGNENEKSNLALPILPDVPLWVGMKNRDISVISGNKWFNLDVEIKGLNVPTTTTTGFSSNYLRKFVAYIAYDPSEFGTIDISNANYFACTLNNSLPASYSISAITDIGLITDFNDALYNFRQIRVEVTSAANLLDITNPVTVFNMKLRLLSPAQCSNQRFVDFARTRTQIEQRESVWTTAPNGALDNNNYIVSYLPVYYQPFTNCSNINGLTIGALPAGSLIGGDNNTFILQSNLPIFLQTRDVYMRSATDDSFEERLPQGCMTAIDSRNLLVRIPTFAANSKTYNPGSGRVCVIYNGQRVYAPNMIDVKYAVREKNFKQFASGLDDPSGIPSDVHPVGPVYTDCNNRVLTFQLHQSVIDRIPNAPTIVANALKELSAMLKQSSLGAQYLVLDPVISNIPLAISDVAPINGRYLISFGATSTTASMSTSYKTDSVLAVLQSGGNKPRGIMRSGMIKINEDFFYAGQFFISSSANSTQLITNGSVSFYTTLMHEMGHALGLLHCIDATHANSLLYFEDNKKSLMYCAGDQPYSATLKTGRCQDGTYASTCTSMTTQSFLFLRDRNYNTVNRFFNRKYGIINGSVPSQTTTPVFTGFKDENCAGNINVYNISSAWRIASGGVNRGVFSKGAGGPACSYIQTNGAFTHCGAGAYPITYTVDGCATTQTLNMQACRGCIATNTILIDQALGNICIPPNTSFEGYVDFEADIKPGGSCATNPNFAIFVVPIDSVFRYNSQIAYSSNPYTKRGYFTIPSTWGTATYKMVVVYNHGASSQIVSNIWTFSINRLSAPIDCLFNTGLVAPAGTTTIQSDAKNNQRNMPSQASLADVLLVNIYPNPVNNNFTIEFANPLTSNVTIELLDLSGRAVGFMTTQDSKVEMNTNELVSGMYFVKINNQTTSSTYKIIVQH